MDDDLYLLENGRWNYSFLENWRWYQYFKMLKKTSTVIRKEDSLNFKKLPASYQWKIIGWVKQIVIQLILAWHDLSTAKPPACFNYNLKNGIKGKKI